MKDFLDSIRGLELANEFCIEPRSPLYLEFLDACKKKRKCYHSWCKNKLKLKGFLEMNLDAEDYEIDAILANKIEYLLKLWNDPRVELLCCYHFEPHKKRNVKIQFQGL